MMTNQKGIVLIASYLMVTALATLSIVHFTGSLVARRAQERATNRILAFHKAESGIDWAIAQLRRNPTFTGNPYTTLGADGGYEVTVTTPDPTRNPAVRRIVSTGHSPTNNPQSYAYELEAVTVHLNLTSNEVFNYAVLMNERIKINGNNILVDSYDSAVGDYDPARPGNNGDLRSNETQGQVVEVQGQATVRGDVIVGPGVQNPDRAVQIGPNARVTGQISSAPELVPLPPVTPPEGLRSGGRLVITGDQSVTLGPGQYLFDSIEVKGNGSLKLTGPGPTQLYVQGKVQIGGNGVTTATNSPPNLAIKVIGSQDVKLDGGSTFYGAVYAPLSEVEVGGKGQLEFFGAIMAKTYHQKGNTKVHYDEALSRYSAGSSSNTVTMRSWQKTS